MYLAIDVAHVGQTNANRWMLLAVEMLEDFQRLFEKDQRLVVVAFLLVQHGEIVHRFGDGRMIGSVQRFAILDRAQVEFSGLSVVAFLSMHV